VHGASGRMGARLCELAHHDPALALVGAIARDGSPRLGERAASPAPRGEAVQLSAHTGVPADAVIDFSSEAGLENALKTARNAGAALLVGTTGLSDEAKRLLRDEARHRAVILAPNTSVGVAVLARAVRELAAALASYDCSIVEAHHNKKKDAPSGTALRLAQAARDGGAALTDASIVAVRGGDVVGEHTVRFAGVGEYVELTHRATSRDLFARGALRAAAWLKGRAPGWYTMEDVLGFGAS
jgi:4-hydroxy-tetrahydrodipicolinate reductase